MTQCRVIGIEWPNWEPLNYILLSVYREDIRKLEEENKFLKAEIELLKKPRFSDRYLKKLEEENKKLREFKAKQEEMMFLIWASIELAEPKTAWDAEKLQKGKEIYEKLYKEELYHLREENQSLKERIEELEQDYDRLKVAFEDVVSWK